MFVAQIGLVNACYFTRQRFTPTLSKFIKYLPSLQLSALDSNPSTNLSTVSKYLCRIIVLVISSPVVLTSRHKIFAWRNGKPTIVVAFLLIFCNRCAFFIKIWSIKSPEFKDMYGKNKTIW